MSLMVNNGIYQKVERDIKTATAFRHYFDRGFWIPELLRPNKPLHINHTIPSFIALGLGLISATFIFSLEIFLPQKKSANLIVGTQAITVSDSDVSDTKKVDGIHTRGILVDVWHASCTTQKFFQLSTTKNYCMFSSL